MEKNEYIKTFTICGKDIDLGLDDYGQCYFVEWTDENGVKKDVGLGTYNLHYMEEIYYMFDPTYKLLSTIDLYGEEFTPEEKEQWDKYQKIFDEEYSSYGDMT